MADGLHSLIGMSEDTTVSYLVSLSEQAQSVDKLKTKLFNEDWLPQDNPKSQAFIERLFSEFAPKPKTQMSQQTLSSK